MTTFTFNRPRPLPLRRGPLPAAALLAAALLPTWAQAEPRPDATTASAQAMDGGAGLPQALAADVRRLAGEAAALVWGPTGSTPRIEVLVGKLDSRLKLAPCQQVAPYLPAGMRPLGNTRIGLRCLRGPALWNVSLPVQVRVWGTALAAATALPTGTVLEARHLVSSEVDLAERPDPAINLPGAALGRTLARGLAAGEALRRNDLKTRQWFNTGDTVRIVAVGPGYAISSEGQALGPGLEGQPARARTESGRIVTGVAAGQHRIEVAL